MNAFDILGDPLRRRILEMLADDELTAGAVCTVIQREFGTTQPGVSRHLKVLRVNGFATVRPDGARRLYAARYEHLRGRCVAGPVPGLLDTTSERAGGRARSRQESTTSQHAWQARHLIRQFSGEGRP